MMNNNLPALSAAAGDNYRSWLTQLQERFQHYLQLAAAPPAAGEGTAASPNDDTVLLEMTRREIEVLAACHCELQRMITDQNQRIEAVNTELQENNDLAERLQVEVEKRNGGNISPRRQAKNALRLEIASMRKQIDEAHRTLLAAQSELADVKAEHADVRMFISKQFFPVARVAPDQKWRDHNKAAGTASGGSSNGQQHGGGGGDEKTKGFTHGGKEFVVRPTKGQELREAMVAERRKGFVPGTTVKSSTFDLYKGKEQSERQNLDDAADAKLSAALKQQAGKRVKDLPPDGPLPHQLGNKGFVLKKVSPKSSRNDNGAGATAQLSQERNVRASPGGRPPFRGPSLISSNESHGIHGHGDPTVYGEE